MAVPLPPEMEDCAGCGKPIRYERDPPLALSQTSTTAEDILFSVPLHGDDCLLAYIAAHPLLTHTDDAPRTPCAAPKCKQTTIVNNAGYPALGWYVLEQDSPHVKWVTCSPKCATIVAQNRTHIPPNARPLAPETP